MKKLLMLTLLLPCMLFTACGDDDEKEKDNWKDNKDDVAVTGSVKSLSFAYAEVEGVVNLDKTSVATRSADVYVEYWEAGRGQDYEGGEERVENIVGNRISATLRNLLPKTKYEYRVSVNINGVKYVGETRTFVTEAFENLVEKCEVVNNDPDRFEMKVVCKKNYDFEKGKRSRVEVSVQYAKSRQDLLEGHCREEDAGYDGSIYFHPLDQKTTYYYRTVVYYERGGYDANGVYDTERCLKYGDVKSFTTSEAEAATVQY